MQKGGGGSYYVFIFRLVYSLFFSFAIGYSVWEKGQFIFLFGIWGGLLVYLVSMI